MSCLNPFVYNIFFWFCHGDWMNKLHKCFLDYLKADLETFFMKEHIVQKLNSVVEPQHT